MTNNDTANEYINSETGLQELCLALSHTDDAQLLEEFLRCLLTKTEIRDVSYRWLLVREIDKGTTQREIARMFGMSLCKITRGSKELKKENSAFRRMLEIFQKTDKDIL